MMGIACGGKQWTEDAATARVHDYLPEKCVMYRAGMASGLGVEMARLVAEARDVQSRSAAGIVCGMNVSAPVICYG